MCPLNPFLLVFNSCFISLLSSKRYAKGAIFVYLVVFALDYEIWMDSKQSMLYQIDRASPGGSVILKVT